jgi:hypothetical protein
MSVALQCRGRRCSLVHNAIAVHQSERDVCLDGSPMGRDHERLPIFFRLPYGVRVGEIMQRLAWGVLGLSLWSQSAQSISKGDVGLTRCRARESGTHTLDV